MVFVITFVKIKFLCCPKENSTSNFMTECGQHNSKVFVIYVDFNNFFFQFRILYNDVHSIGGYYIIANKFIFQVCEGNTTKNGKKNIRIKQQKKKHLNKHIILKKK